ncbi:MAG: Uma2 family endonuclease [Ruminococcus sp.]|nr:Uma2 family endonuclease [Ruminococcus sp.]
MSVSNEKKKYTAEEFYKLIPETNLKVELIDGEIVSDYSLEDLISGTTESMPAGTTAVHQTIVGRLFSRFDNFILQNKGSCRTFVSPYDVELDERNTVQPDVMIICDPSKITNKKAFGAPDLVVEVVSSNHTDDYNRKLQLYKNSGVREYWIVDPSEERTIVYLFGETIHISFYAFDQPIPVGIWDNKLEINISELPGR